MLDAEDGSRAIADVHRAVAIEGYPACDAEIAGHLLVAAVGAVLLSPVLAVPASAQFRGVQNRDAGRAIYERGYREGTGEAWIGSEANATAIGPGSTIVAHPNVAHGFRNTGQTPMRSYGVHASPVRITHREGGAD